MSPSDDQDNSNEPLDDYNFLEEMKKLYLEDPEEAIARLEEKGMTIDDLDLQY